MRTTVSTRRRTPRAAAAAAALGLATAGLAVGAAPVASAAEACEDVTWMDQSLTSEERANALLDASDQHQKYRWLNEKSANAPAQTEFGDITYPAQVECTPEVVYANGAEGVHGSPGTTAWPGPIGIAATWDADLTEQKAAHQGYESFENGNAVILGPGLASGRTPMSGRTAEYFGEDPLLGGTLAGATVRGLEHGDPERPVIANVKHYVANEQETDRQTSSSNIDERTLVEAYELPYEIAIAESDPGSVMCSYNQINGVYSCENPDTLLPLTERMGFSGYVMSDFGSVHSVAESLNAGLDQELNVPEYFTPERLDAALEAGEITQERIDEAAFNVVHTYISRGLFDHPVPEERPDDISFAEAKATARQLAEEGTVLLKNEDVLPLDDGQTIAVIGPTASNEANADGISAQTACSAGGFGDGGVLDCSALVDPLTAITERSDAEVVFDDGSDLERAADVAADADVAIVFGHIRIGEFSDPEDIRLDHDGDALFEVVSAAADTTVGVINSGTAAEMPWIDDVDAMLYGWYGGEQFGPALAALLWGDANPSGKLPMTLPVSLADTPAGGSEERYPGVFTDEGGDIRQVDYAEGLAVGYKWYQSQGIDPLFAFGHGLSYTAFSYDGLEVARTDAGATASVTVTNTGGAAGTEVAQAYLTLPDAAEAPGTRLVGFERVALEPGESSEVTFDVEEASAAHPLSVWDVDADAWTTPEGEFGLAVGSASDDLNDSGTFTIDDTAPVIEASVDQRQRVVISASDASEVTIEYRTQKNHHAPSEWISYDGPFQIDARSEITIRVTDAAGNTTEMTTNRKQLR